MRDGRGSTILADGGSKGEQTLRESTMPLLLRVALSFERSMPSERLVTFSSTTLRVAAAILSLEGNKRNHGSQSLPKKS